MSIHVMQDGPVAVEYIWEPRGVVKRFVGVVTAQDFVASVEAVAADPRFDQLRFVLNDFTAAIPPTLEAHHFEAIAVIQLGAQQTNHGIRVLMVGPEAPLMPLTETIQSAHAPGSQPRGPFRFASEARAWLAAQTPLQDVRARR